MDRPPTHIWQCGPPRTCGGTPQCAARPLGPALSWLPPTLLVGPLPGRPAGPRFWADQPVLGLRSPRTSPGRPEPGPGRAWGGGAADPGQAHGCLVPGLPPGCASAAAPAEDAEETGGHEGHGHSGHGDDRPAGAWGGHSEGPETPRWTALPRSGPGRPHAPPRTPDSLGIPAVRAGVSPVSAAVPAGAGPVGRPIALRCWLGGDGCGGRIACEAGAWGPCPPPHLPSGSPLGSACVKRQPRVAGGDSSEWSQGEGGPGLWPKCRLSCHRPGLLATSPAPSPGRAGQPGQPGPCPHWSSRQGRPGSWPLSPSSGPCLGVVAGSRLISA